MPQFTKDQPQLIETVSIENNDAASKAQGAVGYFSAEQGVTGTGSGKVGFVSLGCPKALVDSERILTQLRSEGYD
ncbi:MAG: hypothetical protein MI864_20775, partial [Pseudomonadales bacterium]|nr:hypothetical protein [Pseudomonadales bacterium]